MNKEVRTNENWIERIILAVKETGLPATDEQLKALANQIGAKVSRNPFMNEAQFIKFTEEIKTSLLSQMKAAGY